jgi:hypothetical protein
LVVAVLILIVLGRISLRLLQEAEQRAAADQSKEHVEGRMVEEIWAHK